MGGKIWASLVVGIASLAFAGAARAEAAADPLKDADVARIRQAFKVDGIALFDPHATHGARMGICAQSVFAGLKWCVSGTVEEKSGEAAYVKTTGYNIGADNRIVYAISSRRSYPLKREEFDGIIQAIGERYGAGAAVYALKKTSDETGNVDSLIAVWGGIRLVHLTEAEYAIVEAGGSLKRGHLVDHRFNLVASAKARDPVYKIEGEAGFILHVQATSPDRADVIARAVYQPAFLPPPAKPGADSNNPLVTETVRRPAPANRAADRAGGSAAEEQAKRIEAERGLAAERLLREEAERKAAEERKAFEEEKKRLEDERKAALERADRAERTLRAGRDQRGEDEEARKAAEERLKRLEAERKQAEERAKRADAERKVQEERQRKEEAERKAAAEERAKKAEDERKAAEERARRLEEERKTAEERRRTDEAQRRSEEDRAARADAERKAASERRAAEQKRAQEEAARPSEEKPRRADSDRGAEEKKAADEGDAEWRAEAEKLQRERERRPDSWKKRAADAAKAAGAIWSVTETHDRVADERMLRSQTIFSGPERGSAERLAVEVTFECMMIGRDRRLRANARAFDRRSGSAVAFRTDADDTLGVRTRFMLDDQIPQAGLLFREHQPDTASILELPVSSSDLGRKAPRAAVWLRYYQVAVEFHLVPGVVTATIAPYADNLRRVLEACAQ